jgi:two-component system OmpR family response regulator
MRILLVEDSAPIRLRLLELLNVPGAMHVAATVETELDAHDQIDIHDFDVLVVDVQLRQGSGIGAVRDARARWSVLAPALIIVLTNHSFPTVRQHCLAAGADHFLDKSRQFDQVVPLIMGFSGRAFAVH